MPIRYDGRSIIRHNDIDYDSYRRYSERQREENQRLTASRMDKISKESYGEWLRGLSPDFRDATIESIGEHDPDVMETLKAAVADSVRTGVPKSLMLGSVARRTQSGRIIPRGKTWALYAYISALCNSHVINDPVNEVYMMTEEDLLDNNTNWKDNGSFMSDVFSGRYRLVVVDNINSDAGTMKRKNYGGDAWGRFVNAADAASGRRVGIVLSFSGDYNDVSLRDTRNRVAKLMKNASEAVFTKGVGV